MVHRGGFSADPFLHRRQPSHRLYAAARRGRFHAPHPASRSRRPHGRTAAASGGAYARRGRSRAPRTSRIRHLAQPRLRRLRLPRRRPAQSHGTALPAQAQPHQPFRSGLRLPLRGVDAGARTRVYASRTGMAGRTRQPCRRTDGRAARHAARLRPLRGAGAARRRTLR